MCVSCFFASATSSFVRRPRQAQAQAQASYVAGFPYPSRSPRAHPSGWTRTQGLSHRDSHAPPSFGTTPVRMWNWPLAPSYDEAEIKLGRGASDASIFQTASTIMFWGLL